VAIDSFQHRWVAALSTDTGEPLDELAFLIKKL
jgi:hypothetical protein